jgi:FKBP-type peptidyl-prolyl cis-trans isomerase
MDDTPFKFTLGKKEVIPGWEEGFKLMSEGEKGYLIIPANLAYGKKGVKNPDNANKYLIPPDTMLIFEVELVSFK